MKTCPRCGNVTANDNARFCNRCGSSMDAAQPNQGTINASVARDVPKPKTDDASRSKIVDTPDPRPKHNDRPKAVKTKKGKSRNRRSWVLPVVVVCAVAVCAAVLTAVIQTVEKYTTTVEEDKLIGMEDTPTDEKDIPTVAELFAEKDDKASKSLKMLQNGIDSTVLPQDIGGGVTVTDLYIKDGYYCYEYECDEDLLDLDVLDISLQEENIRANLIKQKQHDSSLQWLLEHCQDAGLDLAYIYIGDETGTTKIARIAIADL